MRYKYTAPQQGVDSRDKMRSLLSLSARPASLSQCRCHKTFSGRFERSTARGRQANTDGRHFRGLECRPFTRFDHRHFLEQDDVGDLSRDVIVGHNFTAVRNFNNPAFWSHLMRSHQLSKVGVAQLCPADGPVQKSPSSYSS